MITNIHYGNQKFDVDFRVNHEFGLELLNFSPVGHKGDIPEQDCSKFDVVNIQCTGENAPERRGYKHNAGTVKLSYDEREEYQNNFGKKVEFHLSAENGLEVIYHLQFYIDLSIVRSWVTVINQGTEAIGLEYISSFLYHGLCKNGTQPYWQKSDVYIPYNSWCTEAQWKKFDLEDLGLNRMLMHGYHCSGDGFTRYSYGSFGSWSSAEHLPMGYLSDRETNETYFWQIESSCGWHAEYGTTNQNHLYIALSGPTENEGHWWKNLLPGQQFTTVTAAFGVVEGGIDKATAELTQYRRLIRRLNQDNLKLHIVFNDYMNCLNGDPTEEKEFEIIDRAAALGCEYYCMDAGWYDKGFWWNRVGEWKESPERFPNGLKKVFDYARSKGLKPGVWVEIEVMGTACPIADTLPDNWFFQHHGKRYIERDRYLLDFRNPEVQAYTAHVIERLIHDYGLEFFKIDYNVTTGIGTDYQSDSFGDGLLEHVRCLHQWYDNLYAKYPNLIIENCGSGGQRMDYGMLQRQSLQSTSDQTDYLYNSYIAANVASAVTPEQAGMWVYPYQDNPEHVIYNMVNGLLLRPYMSGLIWSLSDACMELLKEGISLYKTIRQDIRQGVPFFPLGFANIKDSALAYGLSCQNKIYLSVFGVQTDKLEIPLSFEKIPSSIKVIYPKSENCNYQLKDQRLTVKLPQIASARLFEIQF